MDDRLTAVVEAQIEVGHLPDGADHRPHRAPPHQGGEVLVAAALEARRHHASGPVDDAPRAQRPQRPARAGDFQVSPVRLDVLGPRREAGGQAAAEAVGGAGAHPGRGDRQRQGQVGGDGALAAQDRAVGPGSGIAVGARAHQIAPSMVSVHGS